MNTIVMSCIAALSAILVSSPVLAQSAGSALGVDTAASATLKNETRPLVVGADIFIGDRVETDAKGLVQIRFSDQTRLVVGPNSKLVIDDYLLRADNSAGKFAVNALAGTFRFVTGNAPKDRYQINTPTGTIGVRGTEFDFVVTPTVTEVLLHGGQVNMCNARGNCIEMADQCSLGRFDLQQALTDGHTDGITGAARSAMREAFRFAVNQQSLRREFWVGDALRCTNAPADTAVYSNDPIVGDDTPPYGDKYEGDDNNITYPP